MQLTDLPNPLSGSEHVSIQQTQNGHTTTCTIALSDLLNQINAAAPAWWVASLPTTLPSRVGVLWNNNGSLAIS
ncbi:hypothetical protein [Paraburkholderia sp. BL21I4N1]|uniref:hypothetical protein n=1 Tax=Paraburkholderia sp. BL21I4N1 TaxID=1938801 RepID=UPI000CFB4FE7|nr:hypothetical protein [Paraburkholderia sp. BL21I4N1]PQV51804.1 hypothetical protein B0G83_10411 [Paraburkholderia sp. BL21I4N1]